MLQTNLYKHLKKEWKYNVEYKGLETSDYLYTSNKNKVESRAKTSPINLI